MQNNNIKEKNLEKYLSQHLSGDPPRETFKQKVLRDSTAALVRKQRRRSAWRRAECAAAAVLIAGFGFLGGRLSMPHTLPSNVDITPQATAGPDGITVPSDLVAWLDAARLFRQLGMKDRMDRAVERAGRLLPVDTVIVDCQTGPVLAARSIENKKERVESMDIPGSNSSVQSVNQILAQVFGD